MLPRSPCSCCEIGCTNPVGVWRQPVCQSAVLSQPEEAYHCDCVAFRWCESCSGHMLLFRNRVSTTNVAHNAYEASILFLYRSRTHSCWAEYCKCLSGPSLAFQVRLAQATDSSDYCHPDDGGDTFLRNAGFYKSHTA
jgi:hypothetical protein